jgi:hypothetical protein
MRVMTVAGSIRVTRVRMMAIAGVRGLRGRPVMAGIRVVAISGMRVLRRRWVRVVARVWVVVAIAWRSRRARRPVYVIMFVRKRHAGEQRKG